MKLLNSESIAHNKQYRFEILDILNAFKPLCDEFYLLFDDIGKHSLVGSAVEKHIIEFLHS